MLARLVSQFLVLCTVTAISLWIAVLALPGISPRSLIVWPRPTERSPNLDIASQIYVVSLPRRLDRRGDMEKLRAALGLQWTYFDALDAQHPVVDRISERVRRQRRTLGAGGTNLSLSGATVEFRWPDEIDALASSTDLLDMPELDSETVVLPASAVDPEPPGSIASIPPLVCATRDNDISAYNTTLPEYRILTPEKIACWYSHLAVIRQVANRKRLDGADATVILEDDIDMESDIRQRLGAIWSLLPAQWDIVFLGHCWSNESYYPALQPPQSQPSAPHANQAHLHPSHGPKCTHAYVLSHLGARRILLHLLYPPFAYSRAIDQALMWLVRSGRLKSFSVVPSVVVQRKVVGSDVMSGKGGSLGSEWKDGLVNGVFET